MRSNPFTEIVETVNHHARADGMVYSQIAGLPLWWFLQSELCVKLFVTKGLRGDPFQTQTEQPIWSRWWWKVCRQCKHSFSGQAVPKHAAWFVGATDNLRLPDPHGKMQHYLFPNLSSRASTPTVDFTVREAQLMTTNLSAATALHYPAYYLDALVRKHRLIHWRRHQKRTDAILGQSDQLMQFIGKLDGIFRAEKALLNHFEHCLPHRLTNIFGVLSAVDEFIADFDPGAIAMVCYYGTINRALCWLAKQRGIPTIDIQHGIIGVGHPSYHLGTGLELKALPLPDYVFCFGNYWRQVLLQIGPWPAQNIFEVGNASYHHQRPKMLEQKRAIGERVRTALGLNPSDRVLLVTTNRSTSSNLIDFIQASGVLKEKEKPWKVVFKRHPIKDLALNEFRRLLPESVIILTNEIPLYELFAAADAHLTVHSTSIFEGLQMLLPTFVALLPCSEFVEDLMTRNIVVPVNAHELLPELNQAKSRSADHEKILNELYHLGDPVASMVKALQNILRDNRSENQLR